MASSALSSRCAAVVVAWILVASPALAQPRDPAKLLAEADRLAWMKPWSRAEPLFVEAQKLFEARGDRLNALHAKVGHLRAQLPRLPAPDVSRRLGDLLDDPLVQGDDRLRLRVLVVKGETDEDLDPASAQQSWQEAQKIAERLGDAATANRARGELGIVAALLGDVSASIIQLGIGAQGRPGNNDVPSVVRWLTLSGRGFAEMGRTADALGFYDWALAAATTVEELSFPVMTYLGKGEALAKLGRPAEAEATLRKALEMATQLGSLAYQAELSLKLAVLASNRKSPDEAATLAGRCEGLRRGARRARTGSRSGGARGRPAAAEQNQLADAASLLNERHRRREENAGADGAAAASGRTRRGASVGAALRGGGRPARGSQRPARRPAQQDEQPVGPGTDHQRRERHPARAGPPGGHARSRCCPTLRDRRAGTRTRPSRTAARSPRRVRREARRPARPGARDREAPAAAVPPDESSGTTAAAGQDLRR